MKNARFAEPQWQPSRPDVNGTGSYVVNCQSAIAAVIRVSFYPRYLLAIRRPDGGCTPLAFAGLSIIQRLRSQTECHAASEIQQPDVAGRVAVTIKGVVSCLHHLQKSFWRSPVGQPFSVRRYDWS